MQTIEFRRLALEPGQRVLDVGCGSGRHTAAALEYPRVSVWGVDRCFEDLIQARKRLELHRKLGAHGGGCGNLAAADITRLPFADRHFDQVICSEVLEHIPDDQGAIQEMLRVLRPGGVLALSVPRRWPERVCWRLSETYRSESGGHIRIYHARRLAARIEAAGSRCFASHFAHGLHTPYWWLKCGLGFNQPDHPLVRRYHRFLVWDLMSRPAFTRFLERLLNPLVGKSVVLYFRKKRA